jgi:sec-independent protein translocase protein TatB
MFDISWTEFLLIGIVALVVIGPKELPTVMRTLGQWTRKLRGMASEFQNQFHEAMREAELSDLKKEVDDMARDIKSYDPLKPVREEVQSLGEVGKDFEKKLNEAAASKSIASEAVAPVTAESSAQDAKALEAPSHEAPLESAPESATPEAPLPGASLPGAPLPLTPAAAPEPVPTSENSGRA